MSPVQKSEEPQGKLAIRTIAMPADTNPTGKIFGGWVVSQMDLSGLVITRRYAPSNVVTVSIDKMEFIAPINVGDSVCCYVEIIKHGRTSITLKIQTWAITSIQEGRHQVTEGVFTYVSVDEQGRPIPLINVDELG